MADDQQRTGGAPVGSVAEEAARLLDALGGWAERSGYAGSAAGSRETSEPSPDGAGPACPGCGAPTGAGRAVTCGVCPLCRGIAVLRSVRPETVDRLADLASALAATLRDVAGERRPDDGSTSSARPRPSRVQDIPIDEDEGTEGEHA